MNKFTNKKQDAFTLVETLVAITVLVTAVVAPLTISASSLFQARHSRDQIVATYLAQESIEMVRYIRDRNLMRSLAGINADWLEFLPRDRWFAPDWDTAQDGNLQVCNNVNDPKSCPYLYYSGAYSLNQSAGTQSRFKRAVRITVNSGFPDEILIESRVFWISGTSGERSVDIKTRLYNWAVVE